MPVKFWQTIVRFWFFLCYLITTVLDVQAGQIIQHIFYLPKWQMFIVLGMYTFAPNMKVKIPPMTLTTRDSSSSILHSKIINFSKVHTKYTQSLSIRNALKIYDIFVYYITDVDLLLQRIIRWWLDLQMGVISNSEVSWKYLTTYRYRSPLFIYQRCNFQVHPWIQ